jgi:hypothetical protein
MKELENVKILFYYNYWDGPLNGICEYENKMYWYDTVDDISVGDEDSDDWTWYRLYNVKEIEPWQLSYELYWHSIFCTNVATHTEFDKKLVNDRFLIKKTFRLFKHKRDKWINPFYYNKREKEYKKIDYSKNQIIGTFKN